jgi:deleted-in-malignant-brain-tumors protein 1
MGINDVQLIGGSSKYEGRVEVCINRAWGSVCAHNWGHQEAGIVCNQIGSMKYKVRYGYASSFGFPIDTDVPVLLGYLYCKGHEKTLIECDQSYSYTNFYCNSNYYDVGLICQAPCVERAVRSNDDGYVELCLNGTWGTICSDYWDNNDASVICKQLGHSPYGAIGLGKRYNEQYISHFIIDINCTGTEETIWDCPRDNVNVCSSDKTALIICQVIGTVDSDCIDGDIRLVDGRTKYEGRVEVCINRAWGSVCSQGWGALDCQVLCVDN